MSYVTEVYDCEECFDTGNYTGGSCPLCLKIEDEDQIIQGDLYIELGSSGYIDAISKG